MIKFLTKQGEKRELQGSLLAIRNTLSVTAALYLVFAILFYPEPILHRSIAFGLFYAIIFLSYSSPGVKASKKVPIYDWIMSILSLSVSVYIAADFDRIVNRLVFVDPVFY